MVCHLLRGICSRVRGIFCSEQGPAKEAWKLVPLTPEYLVEEHSGYVAAIEAALANDQISNIALSGNYGVGKSSIMREVARRQGNRIVELSLSTLAPIEASQLDDSVPYPGHNPDQPYPAGDRQAAALSRIPEQNSWLTVSAY